MRALLAGWACVALAAMPVRAEPGVLVVTVSGVHSAAGHVLVAICDHDNFLQETCPYHASVPAALGAVVVRVTGLPAGVYAAQAYHDENDNHRIDRSLLGIPTEGIGFSNDAKMRFGPPAFSDAAFTLPAIGGSIQLTLRYY